MGRIITLTGAIYVYDGDGTMVKSIINGVSTYYPGRHYNLEVNGTTSIVQKNYAFGSQTIAVRTGGVVKWVLADHLGSTSITANADGSLNSEIRYSAFGEVRFSSGTTPKNRRWLNLPIEVGHKCVARSAAETLLNSNARGFSRALLSYAVRKK